MNPLKHRSPAVRLLTVVLPLLLGPSFAVSAEEIAVPTAGSPFSGTPVSIELGGDIVFATPSGKQSLPAEELVRWGTPQEFLRGPVVVLADGGRLAAEITQLDQLQLVVESALFGAVTFPLERVAGIVFLLPADLHRQTLLFDRLVRTEGQTDRVLLENGDELTGLLTLLDAGRVRIDTQAGPVETDRRNVTAVLFNPGLRRTPSLEGRYAWVGLNDGSLFPATAVELDGPRMDITAAAGELGQGFSDDLALLQPMGGRLVYLSSLTPEDYRCIPYLDVTWPYLRNRNVTGGPLRCGSRVYLTGIGMHTTSRLSYRLGGRYVRFQSEVGVDDSTDGRGNVRFRVFVDGREQYSSGPVRGGEMPKAVDLDVSRAEQLDLVVDFAERAQVLDRADWLDARLLLGSDQ